MDGGCALCAGELETADHILRTCTRAREIWLAFATSERRRQWRQMDVKGWITNNITEDAAYDNTDNWPRRFTIIAWWLWKWRCERVFNDRDAELHRHIVWLKTYEEEVERAFSRCNARVITSRPSRIVRVRWNASPEHRFTLNVDGSVHAGINRAGYGGVIRNSAGDWIRGIMCRTIFDDPAIVEAQAIVECLNWAWHEGYRDLEVQSDAKDVVQWIREGPVGRGPIRHLIEGAQQWLNRDWRISFRVIYREQNNVADRLAKFGATQDDERRVVDFCPIGSEDVYLDDLAHVTSARRVVELAH